jgi:hypothetical protein
MGRPLGPTDRGSVIAVPIATVALVVSALIFAPLSSYLAGRRARSPLIWFALGVVIGPLAVVLLLLAPPGRCPECAERVHGWPRTCIACGASLGGAVAVGGAETAAPPAADAPVVVRTLGPSQPRDPTPIPPPPALIPSTPPPPMSMSDRSPSPTEDRSWEVVTSIGPTPGVAGGMTGATRMVRPGAVGPDAHLLGSAVFIGGTAPTTTRTRLEVGDRYGLARDGDELQILGPVTIDPERIVARIPLAGAQVELTADRLVVTGGDAARGAAVAFSALAVSRRIDLAAVLGAPAGERPA